MEEAYRRFCASSIRSDAGDWEGALSELQAAIHYDPESSRLCTYAANLLLLAGREAEAVQVLRKGTRLADPDPEAYILLAAIRRKNGDEVAAAHCYRQALRLDPHQRKAYLELALLAEKRGRRDDALRHLQSALREEPGSVEMLLRLAGLCIEMKLDRSALRYIRLAEEQKPTDLESLVILAETYASLNLTEDALAVYREAGRRYAGSPLVHRRIGFLLLAQKRLAEALEAFAASQAIDPIDEGTLFGLGVALDRTGRRDEAMRLFHQVILINRETPTPATTSGMCTPRKANAWKKRRPSSAARSLSSRTADRFLTRWDGSITGRGGMPRRSPSCAARRGWNPPTP